MYCSRCTAISLCDQLICNIWIYNSNLGSPVFIKGHCDFHSKLLKFKEEKKKRKKKTWILSQRPTILKVIQDLDDYVIISVIMHSICRLIPLHSQK